ncbi:MAG: capsule assembly Wzi family protein [Woeseiaceae bacterium]
MSRLSRFRLLVPVLVSLIAADVALAEPWVGPGDTRLRNDLQLLTDSGVMNIPMTAWPMAWGDIDNGLQEASIGDLPSDVRAALDRVRRRGRSEMEMDSPLVTFSGSGASNPRSIRTFENTPRTDGEVSAGMSWLGERFAFNLSATYVDDPFDGDEVRPDGTYIGAAVGNWMLSAGWQERWWGPGRDGSLILSTNARPFPSIGIQRNASLASNSKWFAWMGPWTLTSFMGLLDDDRVIEDGLLWGFRASFRPVRGLEIGLSRAAQWCGSGRDCDFDAFFRVLNGNDNQGANVDPEDEPGNQLGGFDVRWTLPRQIPVALYLQWTAEDTRKTGAQLHQWLHQVGMEHWGMVGSWSHRTHLEFANSSCHLGALGEGSAVPNCAYNSSVFVTGYRYKGRSIGHSMDGDGLSYSLGSTLVEPAGHSWNVLLRHIEINRSGVPDSRHTVSATPQRLTDVQVSHQRQLAFGKIYAGVGYTWLDDEVTDTDTSEFTGFIRWSSQ